MPHPPLPTVKRTKRSHPNDEGAAASVSLPSLSNFFLLPRELQSLIINFACRPPSSASTAAGQTATGAESPLDDGSTAHSALPGLDTMTTLGLVCASRSLYALVTPLIFSHVWLSRPSQLVCFQQAVAARPQLGRLVKHLHVGPDNELPEWWFPTDEIGSHFQSDPSEDGDGYQPATSYITTTLRREKEAHLLPSGCRPKSLWGFQEEGRNPQTKAINQALRTALRVINVDMLVNQRDLESEPISSVMWTQRVFEVHAAFELYLIKCQDFEREKGIRWKHIDERLARNDPRRAIKHPVLVLVGFPPRPRKACDEPDRGEEAFVVTRSDVLRHLARPGAITDRFDHPLLFARFGWDTEARTALTRRVDSEVEDFVDAFSSTHHYGIGSSASPRSSEVLDPSLPMVATLGSLTAQLRSVLSFTPFLENLSLTGFLERAVSGGRPATSLLKALRSVCLGPHPSCWLSSLRLESLGRVEHLRVTRNGLCEREARDVVAYLPRLRELEWRVPEKVLESEHLLQSVNVLIGRTETTVGPAAGATAAAGSPQGEAGVVERNEPTPAVAEECSEAEVSHPINTSHGSSLPLITLRLHPDNVKFLLDSAPSAEARTAWQSGKAWGKGIRRLLHVVENDSPAGVAHSSSFGDFANDAVYEDGRKWWLKHGGLEEEV